MGVRINTNLEAMNAQRNLSMVSTQFAKSVERLSSGLRINRAGDDAAGLSISEKLRAQVKGVLQASRNAQDGISMIQTAEGALNEVHSMLQRMRELAVQAANDTLSDQDRDAINTELQQLKDEINAISARTKFNGKELLTGSLTTSLDATTELKENMTITGGTESAFVTKIDVSGAQPGKTYTLTASGTSLTLTRSGDNVAQTITLSNISANGTATLDFSQLGVKITLGSSGGITAANLATALTAAANDTVVTATGSGSANFQIGSEASNTLTVNFERVDISTSGLATLNTALSNFNTSKTVANAQALITAADEAITTVNTRRANLGAYQNRLEHTIANLGVAAENLAASESRIRDVDVAAETVQFIRAQILQQAGTSVLAQANQAPQAVLALLR